MKDIKHETGIIGRETVETESYKVDEYPGFKAIIEKDITYVVKGLHQDKLKISGKKGNYIQLDDNISTGDVTFWERIKFTLSLLNHIFDKSYWSKHVTKDNTIEEGDDSVIDLKLQVQFYNNLLSNYRKIDGKIIKNEETIEIQATKENLADLIEKLQAANKGVDPDVEKNKRLYQMFY